VTVLGNPNAYYQWAWSDSQVLGPNVEFFSDVASDSFIVNIINLRISKIGK
jgi:hypothetical protein